ncbi:MAG TPA: ABC transporter ATP-binding protein [Chloroflexota bacterium]|nr:ABC transporter ATP-binding protein [Chloroflexota bacterium]
MIEAAEQVDEVADPEIDSDLAIQIEGMVKCYGRTTAVDHLSMHVPRGSIYGFVGPNGAGKTTTIRTLATLQRPDSGTVLLDGLDVLAEPGRVRDRVGYMPDFFGVYDTLTVEEYLDFYGASYRIPTARRRRLIEELLQVVDLTEKHAQPVEVLSRGMKQRLGLARCLIHDPEVLLLDEPASGMDPRARIELREILRDLSNLNKTVIVSSHILPELAEMCTHIGVIQAGRIIAEGLVGDVIAALSHGPRLRIQMLVPDQLEIVARAIAEFTGSSADVLDERTLVAPFDGSDGDMAELLAALVARGAQVTSFALETGTLEDVFLQATERWEEET